MSGLWLARWEHQRGTLSPGPVGQGWSSASFVTSGTEAEWTRCVGDESPQLSEASYDSTVCHFEKLATAQA